MSPVKVPHIPEKLKTLKLLEQKYAIELPTSYTEWFMRGGPHSRNFIGSDMDLPYLPELNEWAIELLEESGCNYKLPNNSFVFAMHQGYQFMYFICDGNNDPEVWYYLEGDMEPYVEWKSFSDFINCK